MSKSLKIIFVLSIALNLFFGGFMVGKYIFRENLMKRPPLREMMKEGPDRDALVSRLSEFKDKREDERKMLMQEHKVANDIIINEPFDKDAYSKQVRKIAKLQSQLFEDFAEEIAVIMLSFPQEKRKEMLSRFEAFRPMGGHRKKELPRH